MLSYSGVDNKVDGHIQFVVTSSFQEECFDFLFLHIATLMSVTS